MLLILGYLFHSLFACVLSLPGNTDPTPAVVLKCRLRGSDSSASAIISSYSSSTPCSSSESVVYTSSSICSTTRVNSKSGSSSSQTALVPTSQSIQSSKRASLPSVTMTSGSWPSASSTDEPLQTQSINVPSSPLPSAHRSSSAHTNSHSTATFTGSRQETPYRSKSSITSTVIKSQYNVPSITFTDSLPPLKSKSSSRPPTTTGTRTRKPSTSASVTQPRVPESATPSTPIQFPPSYNPNYPTWQPPPVPSGFSSMEEYKLWWMNPDYESKPFLKKKWSFLPSPFPPAGEPPPNDFPTFDSGVSVGGDGSPLIFDMNDDGKVSAKRGVGITLEPEQVNDRDGGAVDGDKMLAMSDINGNGVIDIEEVFGNFTISPFTRKPYKARNGFVALKLLAQEIDGNGCDGAFHNESMVALQAIKKCLRQKLNINFGFIARNNVKVIEPLGIAMYVDVKNYLETPNDYQNGILHGQKGQFIKTDGSTGKVHDVWF